MSNQLPTEEANFPEVKLEQKTSVSRWSHWAKNGTTKLIVFRGGKGRSNSNDVNPRLN